MTLLATRLNPGNWVSAAPWPGSYWRGLGVIVLAYFVSLGWLLASTDGLPYVLDNNETYSSLVHATNILRFGVKETYGLADESYGLEPSQHPYVYTHGGNFPRFYALLLYVLGARTAEAQIAATTFTVGLVGLLLAYHFFSRVATPSFAVVYCLLLTTDFLMQTQWLVNTWRVWHHFFAFSSLLCVHGFARRGRLPPWLVAITLLNFACLAYFELVFAAFVTLLAAIYIGLILRRRRRRLLQTWLWVAGGAVLGATVLIAQVIGYLGWQGFLDDVNLTFLARNSAPTELSAFREEVWSHVEEHRVVFWDNIPSDVGGYRVASALFRYGLLTYTPALVFFAFLIASAWALSFVPSFEVTAVSAGSPRAWSAPRTVPWALGAAGLFTWATTADISFAGLTDEGRPLEAVGALVAGIAVIGWGLPVVRRLFQRKGTRLELPASRVIAAAALLLVFAAAARLQPLFYGTGAALQPLFRELLASSGGRSVWHLATLVGAGLAVSLLLARRSAMGPEPRKFRRLFLFVLAGVVAGVAVFCLFPGYVVSGYLKHYCPLTLYVHLVPFAAAFYVLVRVSLHSLGVLVATRAVLSRRQDSVEPPGSRSEITPEGHLFLGGGAVMLLGLLSGYWLTLQVGYTAWLDPRATLLKELQKPQYQGASFVVNNYAAPVAFTTQGWAYFDPVIGQSELEHPTGKFYLRRDFRYLWLADKRSNPQYFWPDYYLCWPVRQLQEVFDRPKCQNLRIVAEARAGTGLLGHREVARDPSGLDAWSIVKLDWTYPRGSGRKIEWNKRQFRTTLALPK
jgi:hypothetical protein